MRRIVNLFPGGMTSAGLRQTQSAILAAAALIGIAACAGFGYGFMHYRQIAAGQEATLRHVEIANADLQDALDHLRDDTRKRLQQLKAENDRLQLRLSEFEQELVSLRPGVRPSPKMITRTPGPVAAPSEQLPLSALSLSAVPTGTKNFSVPSWVPDFFSDESDAFVGSSTQKHLPPRHGKARRR